MNDAFSFWDYITDLFGGGPFSRKRSEHKKLVKELEKVSADLDELRSKYLQYIGPIAETYQPEVEHALCYFCEACSQNGVSQTREELLEIQKSLEQVQDFRAEFESGNLRLSDGSRIAESSMFQDLAKGGAGGAAVGLSSATVAWTLVSSFGSATTGAAISGLSGAASFNATMAWFGGGALAAGGGGMAIGTVVLGGILILPIAILIPVLGWWGYRKNMEKLKEAFNELKKQLVQAKDATRVFERGVMSQKKYLREVPCLLEELKTGLPSSQQSFSFGRKKRQLLALMQTALDLNSHFKIGFLEKGRNA